MTNEQRKSIRSFVRKKKKKKKKKSREKKKKKNTDISRNDKPIRDVPEETINALGIREKEARGGVGGREEGEEGRAWVTAIEEARLTSVEKTRGSVFIK